MSIHLVVLLLCLVVVVKSADLLVEYSVRLARSFGLSDLVVGLVITSLGTSLPELASAIAAALAGSPGLVIGNVVGSNIANIGLVLGVAAVIRPFATQRRMVDRDGFVLVASAMLFFAVALDNLIGRIDAAVFLALYAAYIVFAARTDHHRSELRFRDSLRFVFDFGGSAPVAGRSRDPRPAASPRARQDRRKMAHECGVALVCLAALTLGAHHLVVEAVWLARFLELPENLIGLSLIALGTSLPELLVAVASARRGNAEMVVGNVMGSNIANTLLIVGIAGTIRPLAVAESSVVFTLPIMLLFSLALVYFIRSNWRVDRSQGVVALIGYAAFLVAAFLEERS
jgi:cation:H+ antiporter